MVVIGIDSHKDTLAGCLIDGVGRPVQHRSVANTVAGHGELVDWAHGVGVTRVAVEGSGGYGRPAALALMAAGVAVVDVPPQMTAAARRRQRTGAKSDEVDALLVARIGARDADLAPPRPPGRLEELRCVVVYRREQVKARTAEVNRLHADLGQICCGYHRGTASLTSARALERVSRLVAGDTRARGDIARQRVRRIRELNRQIGELTAEIAELVAATETTLTDIRGVGVLVAADILAEVGDAARFATKARFAMANGTAPLPASSGRTVRHRLNRGGNRHLNRAIHVAALTQIARPDTEGRRLYDSHIARGKTKREALRCLKRRISDRIWDPPPTRPLLTTSRPVLDIGAHCPAARRAETTCRAATPPAPVA